jgi:hypothetical protein
MTVMSPAHAFARRTIPEPATAPTSAILSSQARVGLGCLEILAAPSPDGLVEVTGFSDAEIQRCLAEIRAVGQAVTKPA